MEIQPVVVGTAGHIDHGKSTLVRALTGIDPDRLKEERERGLTIDLGFANFALEDGRRVGIVDVPGHERFVRNMVAGATGVDVVVLVVAADDGVMPQTREHLAIMELLGIERGLVALTKIDAVEADLAELVTEELAEFLQGTFLADAPVMGVSGLTGDGLPEFKAKLIELCLAAAPRSAGGVFRMPIQRVFSAKGFGTVTTGIPVSGTVEPGDEVEVLPLGKRSKVRGTHAYGETATRVRAGHSSALNLSDIEHGSVRRGDVVATPGFFRAADMYAVRLRALGDLPRALKDRQPVRFHTGTADPHGELVLLDAEELKPGAEVLAQVRLAEPIVAAPGDRFVLRLLSPERTLGGGVVLEATEHRLKRGRPEALAQLARAEQALDSPAARALAALERRGPEPASYEQLAAELQQPKADVQALVAELVERGEVLPLGRADRFAAAGAVADALDQLAAAARAQYVDRPLRLDVDAGELRARTGWPKGVLEPLLERAALLGRAEHRGAGAWRFADVRPDDPDGLADELDRVAQRLAAGALRPPAPDELAPDAERAVALLGRLVDEGRAVHVGGDLYFAREAFDRALAAVRENCAANGSLDIPVLREKLDTTRKWIIPLLEYLDGIGITMRQGSHRVLRTR